MTRISPTSWSSLLEQVTLDKVVWVRVAMF